MCIYSSVNYSCGNRRMIVAEWCGRYIKGLQSHLRCPPDVQYYTRDDQPCPRCREAAADRPPPPWMPIDQRHSRSPPRYCH
ncbi:hypothetical protein PspLS_08046 [Pyricularia sp. CBS 133598]|nr:hypothetical protein PspLS_08046 [Pyricularia sp. CBS 133598]